MSTALFVTADGEVPLKKPLTQLAAPTLAAHTVRKYDLGSLPWKQPVRVSTTANVNLSSGLTAGTTINGVVLAAGDRVLVFAQSDQKQNGIYIVPASGAASRAPDAETGEQLVGAYVSTTNGTANAKHLYLCFSNPPITIGTSNIAWTDITTFLAEIAGSLLIDGTVPLIKLEQGDAAGGDMIFYDKDSNLWIVLPAPEVASVLKHDGGTTNDPYWDPL